jgi:hypothetical protein
MPLWNECSRWRVRTQTKWRRKRPAGMSRANRSTSFRRLSRLKLAPRKGREVFGGA